MSANPVQIALTVEAGADAREREELTLRLRRELRQLSGASVERPVGGEAPPGTRAVELAQVGQLLVTLGGAATAVGALVAAVRSWLAAQGSGTVKMTIGGDTIEITGQLSAEQRWLMDTWIEKHR